MVRNIVVLGGTSHPQLTEVICNHLGIPPAKIMLGKFAVGETRVEVQESVRGKDVYVIQSGGGNVNDHLIELLITIQACKTASAKKVTAVLPLFPYSRQSDLPYNKVGAPLARAPQRITDTSEYTFDSRPQTPGGSSSSHSTPNHGHHNSEAPHKRMSQLSIHESANGTSSNAGATEAIHNSTRPSRSNTNSAPGDYFPKGQAVTSPKTNGNTNGSTTSNIDFAGSSHVAQTPAFEPQRGYRQWVAQAGTLVADLLTCAGTDHVITMDLHDPQYQGFFDIPVDNLYGRHLLRKYIQRNIPNYQQAVIVSPDAGGAKRATVIADALSMPFALIHKERRPAHVTDRQNASMILVGNVAEKTAILVDDLADTSNTITRAAKLLKRSGANKIYALVTHGVLSGDAIDRINASALDKVVVTNSVDQEEHKRRCPKLEVLEVGTVFAEAIRRVHHGESISVLFQYD